jgi:hypothetical protein
VGSAVGAQTKEYLGGNNALATLFKDSDIARASAVGFAAGAATAVARGGKIEIARIATDAFGNALGNSIAASARPSSSAATFEQDMDERTAANPLLAAMSKQNRRDLADQILASQAAAESLGGGQENGYASIPYSSGDLPRNFFSGATLGGFIGGSRAEIDLGYDPSKPYVIITAPRLTAEQWGVIDRYEAGRTSAALGAGIIDGVISIPGGIWETTKTVGEGYRGLLYLMTGNINRYQPRSQITLDSIARGFVNSSPVGVLGALASGDYRTAGANSIGTVAGIAGARLGPALNKLPVLNYTLPSLPGFAPSSSGFAGTRYQIGAAGDLNSFAAKPMNSPAPQKWIDNGGTIWNELDGTWVYSDIAGNTVRYPNGYPDFAGGGYVRQSVDIRTVPNHTSDFLNANKAAPLGQKLPTNTWHHHENGTTMQEIDRIIHSRFTHRGGVSIKRGQ